MGEPTCRAIPCEGKGWYATPDPSDESGNTPMQERCDFCEWTGYWTDAPKPRDPSVVPF